MTTKKENTEGEARPEEEELTPEEKAALDTMIGNYEKYVYGKDLAPEEQERLINVDLADAYFHGKKPPKEEATG